MMLRFIPLAFEYDDSICESYAIEGFIFCMWEVKERILFCMQGVEFIFEKEGCMNGGGAGSF